MSDAQPDTSIKVYFIEKGRRNEYDVPRGAIPEFAAHLGLLPAPYRVKSPVLFWMFRAFIESLQARTKPVVTKDNVLSVLRLAKEFCLSELRSECEAFPPSIAQLAGLSGQLRQLQSDFRQLKRDFASVSKIPHQTQERIDAYERGLENFRSSLTSQEAETKQSIAEFKLHTEKQLRIQKRVVDTDIERINTKTETLSREVENLTPCVNHHEAALALLKEEFENRVLQVSRFPMHSPGSVNGIIADLRRKEGRHLLETALKITSKSKGSSQFAVQNVADLSSAPAFFSDDGPGQWICWDFGGTGVRPTHSTIRTFSLRSWTVQNLLLD
jgi:hypothetical protein